MIARRLAPILCAALILAVAYAGADAGPAAVRNGVARALAGEDAVTVRAGGGHGASAGAPTTTGVTAAAGAPTAAAGDARERAWRALLAHAVASARQRPFRGETVWITRTPEGPKSSVMDVRGGVGRLHVGSGERLTLRLGDLGGDVVHHEQGWFAPLPAARGDDIEGALDALAEKYHVELRGQERVLDRRCNRLDISRRSDGTLAERLWVDALTGLLLRRETFDASGSRLRLATYRELDLSPAAVPRSAGGLGAGAGLERRAHQVRPVGDRRLAALEKAGYVVPAELPGGYERVGVYASVGAGGAPLQAVYRDGLYTVSVFQQRGRPDWSTVPDGAVRAELGWPAYEWPGAVPHRLIWEASGTTLLVIGDAPPGDLAALAEALPRPASQRPLERVRRGLSRLWSAMSPWE